MKNIWIISFSAIALSLASCEKTDFIDDLNNTGNEEATNEDGKLKVSFEAYSPQWSSNSRTSLEEGNKVFWNKGDGVMLVSNSGNGYFEWNYLYAQVEGEKSHTATLNGYISSGEYLGHFMFYPDENMLSSTGNELYFNIPTLQTAVAGSFASKLNPSWAITDEIGGSVQFHNAAALLKFKLTDGCEDVSRITLTPIKDNISLSGDFYFNISDKNNVTIGVSGFSEAFHSSSVVLEGEFIPGNNYYFVLSPIGKPLEQGFILIFEKKDGTKYVKTAKAGIINELYSGRIANIGEISLAGAEFTNNIIDKKFIAAVEKGSDISWTKDEDGNVPVTQENIEAMKSVTSLNISGNGLTDLSYLKYFTGLETLDCSSNSPMDLQLDDLVNLKNLNVRNNGLNSLEINNLSNLLSLECSENHLSELNIDNLKNLTQLYCYNNNLKELNLDNLTELTTLSCSLNMIESLKLDNLTKLNYLYCSSNKLTELNVKNLTNLFNLQCNSNSISVLDVSNMPRLNVVYCDYNRNLTSIIVDNSENLNTLSFRECPVSSIDLSNMPYLMSLYCSGSGLTELNTDGCPLLSQLQCGDLMNFNGVLDFSENPNLLYLHCNNSNIFSLNLSNNYNLKNLYCAENKLTELNLEKNTSLNYLYCLNQYIGEGNKLQLYINGAQESLWNDIAPTHSATVDVHIDYSVVSDNDHGSFNESDYTGVLK